MTDTNNPLLRARGAAENNSADSQERNRQWWEHLPMTYADWDSDERLPQTVEDYLQIETILLGASPFLRERYDFSQTNGLTMLEIGCGSGALSCRFAREGAQITAVDITDAAVAMTRNNADIQNVSLTVQQEDAEKLSFSDNSFDYVFSWGVLHHTSDMDQAFREVARVLKPGGRGLAMVYYRPSVAYYVHGLYWLLIKGKLFQGDTIHTVQRHYTDGYHHRYLTKSEMKDVLGLAGLKTHAQIVTQYQKKILPLIPKFLDEFLKNHFGMCLITEFEKSRSQ